MDLCSICLRTNLTVYSPNKELIRFYDNLLDHQIFPNLSVCATCKQLLERCYNFKQLCQVSNRILRDCMKNEKPETNVENLHSQIQPYYEKVTETNTKKEEKPESENITIVVVTNNDDIISNNDGGIEFKGNEKEINDDIEQKLEKIIRNYKNILTESIEQSQLNTSTVPCQETNLNLNDIECNGIKDNDNNRIIIKSDIKHEKIEDNGDNARNGIENNGDNEHNGIKVNTNIECNGIEHDYNNIITIEDDSDNDDYAVDDKRNNDDYAVDDKINNDNYAIDENRDNDDYAIDDNSDNDNNLTDDDSSDDLELINELLKNAKVKSVEMKKKNREIKRHIEVRKKETKRKISPYMEMYKSVFDIVLFTSDEEAKADLLERPNSEYYKNAKAKCTICYTGFKSQKMLDYHMKWHDPSAGDHPCDICEMRFEKSKVKWHKKRAHYAKYSCKKCPLVTYHRSVVISHYKLHQGILSRCKYCGAGYRNHQSYLCHLRVHHPTIYNQTDKVCKLCGRTFASPTALKTHRSKMHQLTEDVETESSIKCDQCDLTFANQKAYKVHVRTTPSHKQSRNTCSKSRKQFDNRQSLPKRKRQARSLKKPRLEACKQCGATGDSLKWLYFHWRTKHPHVPYEARSVGRHLCEQCGRSFQLRCHLVEHMRVHTGERPFVCDECGRAFISKLRLNYHSEWHKPPSRVCAECGKKFTSAANLYCHMRTHIGDRRFKCSLCDKDFLHRFSLTAHIRGVHQKVRRVRKPKQQEKQAQEE